MIKSGGIILFVRYCIIHISLDRYSFPVGFEIFCIELNLRKKKWERIGKAIEFYSKTYENIIMGEFNAESLIWHLRVLSITLKV